MIKCEAFTIVSRHQCLNEASCNIGIESDDPKRSQAWLCGTHANQLHRRRKVRLVPVEDRVESYEARMYEGQ